MAKLPAIQFYTGDWLKDPCVRSCGYAARGLWTDLLCLMSESPHRGYLMQPSGKSFTAKHLARMTGATVAEFTKALAELEELEVFSRNAEGVIFSRRMVRDEAKRQAAVDSGRAGGLASAEGRAEDQREGDREGNAEGHHQGEGKGSPKGGGKSHGKGGVEGEGKGSPEGETEDGGKGEGKRNPSSSSSSSSSIFGSKPPEAGGAGEGVGDRKATEPTASEPKSPSATPPEKPGATPPTVEATPDPPPTGIEPPDPSGMPRNPPPDYRPPVRNAAKLRAEEKLREDALKVFRLHWSSACPTPDTEYPPPTRADLSGLTELLALAKGSLLVFEEFVERYFAEEDHWIRTKHGYSLAFMATRPALLVADAPPRPDRANLGGRQKSAAEHRQSRDLTALHNLQKEIELERQRDESRAIGPAPPG